MARTNATNFSGPLQFPYATAATDLFKKEDVQTLALAVDGHDHSSGKGLALAAGAIGTGVITSAMIVDGTIATADLADGSVTTAKHADASVTNAKLASDTARANLLVNGGMEVWSRGNGAFTTNGGYSADRWQLAFGGTGATLSVSQDTANADSGSAQCLAYTFNGGSGGYTNLLQKIENLLAWQLTTKTVTFSMRVKTTVANSARVFVQQGSNTYGAYHTGNGQYQTLSVTVAWSGTTPASVGFEASVGSGVAYLDNAMLVVGSQAADYVPLHPADETARCLRYFEQSPGNFIGNGYGLTTTVADIFYHFTYPKGGTATITLGPPSAFTLRVIGASVAVTAISSSSPSHDAVLLNPSVASGLSPGSGLILSATGGAVTAEYNP